VGQEVVILFGSVLTKPSIELDDGVYIGSYCLMGDVRIGSDTLIADHVLIPSGAHQHGIERLDIPIRQQAGRQMVIRVGKDCWIGSGAIVLADVGDHCVVAAGSVVTQPVGDYQVVAGVPAKRIGDRRDKSPAGNSPEPGEIEER
jgi:acetyltransferase-like isoleucine patch superfamily enzyme